MKNSVSIRKSIFIERSRETVWDFTQNYDNRPRWDLSVVEATVLQTSPARIVLLRLRGNTQMIFAYKLEDRPNKTSLATSETKSSLIKSAGGSWTYEENGEGTLWTQTNTIIFKNNFFIMLLLPFFRWLFNRQTISAMNRAKKIIEHLKS